MVPACELCKKVFEGNVPPLVSQALQFDFINYLLKLLKDGLDHVEYSSACKAHIVKALKAMARDLARGEEVVVVLDKCPWWATYRGTLIAAPSCCSRDPDMAWHVKCASPPNSSHLARSFSLEQNHDLFISNTPTAGYLTAGTSTAQVAGYLTVCPMLSCGEAPTLHL
jgi:DnaJ family protein C protein 13